MTTGTTAQPGPRRPVLVRAGEAEHLDSIGHVLLADSSTTHGALSSHRVALARGADGAVPHRHDQASELFFVLSGELDVLAGVSSTQPFGMLSRASRCADSSPTLRRWLRAW